MVPSINLHTVSRLAQRLDVDECWLRRLAASMSLHVCAGEVPKSSGGVRHVYAPSANLKEVQRRINWQLLQPIALPPALHGSVPGRSARTNAAQHAGKRVVACLDIKDFYPSVHHKRVYRLFRDFGCAPDVASLLTKLTTYDYHLAQGFPSSPAIANLILAGMLPRIQELSRKHGLSVSLYQDDITFSGGPGITGALKLASRILKRCGFTVNVSKRRIMDRGSRQTVTGWVVNRKVNVSKSEYRELRALLHRCKTMGVESVAERPLLAFKNHIRGRIQRVVEVNPKRGNRLLEAFYSL